MDDAPISEMLARATSRERVDPADGKSLSRFERVTIDGDDYFLKCLSPATDWIMRVTGDHVHRPYLVWRAGIMDAAPPCIDHTVVAMQVEGEGDDAELSILMRDVSEHLVAEGDTPVTPGTHAQFVDHLARLSAAFWDWRDDVGGLTTMAQRLRFFDRTNVAREMAVDPPPSAVAAADAGWRALPERSPTLAAIAIALHDEPELVTGPLSATPVTFLHGDWKMGNLGSGPGGRTILLDWAYPGSGPACWDLWWYVALNRARLPESKEATIARFRTDLERHGVDVDGWFETQLDLCAIGMMATFAWEKAIGDEEELRWWERRVVAAAERVGLELAVPGL